MSLQEISPIIISVLKGIKEAFVAIPENYESIMAFLFCIGALCETINALWPTENKDSFFEKLGRKVSIITKHLPSILRKPKQVEKK